MKKKSDVFNELKNLSKISFGSEDDLIAKIVIPFFSLLGYVVDNYELKYPVKSYRPHKTGRNTEADIVFFSSKEHNLNTSLIAVEVKRNDDFSPISQAKFYASNLHVPFFVTWEKKVIEVYQLNNFKPPELKATYNIEKDEISKFFGIKSLLEKKNVVEFVKNNEIKQLNIYEIFNETEQKYIQNIQNNLRQSRILERPNPQDILDIYIPLRICEYQASYFPTEKTEKQVNRGDHPNQNLEEWQKSKGWFNIEEEINSSSNLIIIGSPGSGKTTVLKNICVSKCFSEFSQVPIFIPIKEMISRDLNVYDFILTQLRRYCENKGAESFFEHILSKGRVLLCMDGIDELETEKNIVARNKIRSIFSEVQDIILANSNNKIIISCRKESLSFFKPDIPANFKIYELSNFSSQDCRRFVEKWFGKSGEFHAKSLLDNFRYSGWPEFSTNPLLLSLTCIVYEKQNSLPDKIAKLYERCTDVLLEEWDTTKRISKYPLSEMLTLVEKTSILSELSLYFHKKGLACFNKKDVLNEMSLILKKIGKNANDSEKVLTEIMSQSGLICSWSIDGYLSFSHFSFQEYFAAKALRNESDGIEIIKEKLFDKYWFNTIKLYSSLGDSSILIKEILKIKDNVLHTHTFFAAECLTNGAEILHPEHIENLISRLVILSESKVLYLKNLAIDCLARIKEKSAETKIKEIILNESNELNTNSHAIIYSVKMLGTKIANKLKEEYIRKEEINEEILLAFNWLPQEEAISILEEIITSQNYPNEKKNKKDFGVRHRRRKAAKIMAEIGEADALPALKTILKSKNLDDYEKTGIVDAISEINDRNLITIELKKILSDISLPFDCRVAAAGYLGPYDIEALQYLLSIVVDKKADSFDRRDAVSQMKFYFSLSSNHIQDICVLMNDSRSDIFFGGPSIAAKLIAKINCPSGFKEIKKSINIWKASKHPDKERVIKSMKELLSPIKPDEFKKNKKNYSKKGFSPFEERIPKAFLNYIASEEEDLGKTYSETLNEYKENRVYGNTLAGILIQFAPKISPNNDVIKSIISFAERMPDDLYVWQTLKEIWERKDLDDKTRKLFFN